MNAINKAGFLGCCLMIGFMSYGNSSEPPTEVLVAAYNARSFEKVKADFVCNGTNDERVINAAIARLVYGGMVRLADGDYNIDAFEQEGSSAVLFGYNDGMTRVITVRGTTESKVYGKARGAILHVTEKAMKAMTTNTTYRVFYGAGRIPEGPGDTYTYTHVNNVNFINFIIRFHDASKPLIGIDGRHFGSMELDMIGVYTERYFPQRYEHLPITTPYEGSIGVYSLPGSNDESARNRYNEVNVGGLHTGFVLDEVDHLVMTGCMAARCVYGYHFRNGSPKTLTMINCCDEGCTHLPLFSGRGGHVTMIDFNVERFNAAYIPIDPSGRPGGHAREERPGTWRGELTYTLQGNAFDVQKCENGMRSNFWSEGCGRNFRTRNLAD